MTNIIKIHAIHKYLTVQSSTTLVLMLCITHLTMPNAMLYKLPSSTLRKYQTIENICTKCILNKNRYLSSSWVLKKLHWLPITKDRTQNPKYLQDLISIKSNTQDNMWSNNTGTMLHTHQKSRTKPLQHGTSGILHQHCGTSYQNSSKIYQPWTS